jgi:hypothetical protein
MSEKILVRVFHMGLACDTGCCGHRVEITLPGGEEKGHFEFAHPDLRNEGAKAWARQLAEETIRDRWPECLDSIDWDSAELEAIDD